MGGKGVGVTAPPPRSRLAGRFAVVDDEETSVGIQSAGLQLLIQAVYRKGVVTLK